MRNVCNHINLIPISIALLIVFFSGILSGQIYYQKLTGVVFDSESHKPLHCANILIETFSKINGASADSSGRFNILLPPGRHTIRVSYLGYNTQTMKDILVGTGKETNITVELTESHQQTGEIVVHGKTGRSLNPMAAVTVRTLRSQDASRYAGGYYDPLRMLANFGK
jgi:hypothetical protein